MALADLLCAGCGGVLPAVPADAGSALGAGGDGVLRAGSEPALYFDDGDDRAAVSGAADLDGADDGGVRGCNPRGPTIARGTANDLAWAADLCGGVYALRRMGAGRGGVVRGDVAVVARGDVEACGPVVCGVYAACGGGAGSVAVVQPALLPRSAGLFARALLGTGD